VAPPCDDSWSRQCAHHGEADVCPPQRRSVVGAVSGDRHDLSLVVVDTAINHRSHQVVLVLRRTPRQHPQSRPDRVHKRLLHLPSHNYTRRPFAAIIGVILTAILGDAGTNAEGLVRAEGRAVRRQYSSKRERGLGKGLGPFLGKT